MSQPYISELEEIGISQFEGRNNLGFIAISKNQMSHRPNINWIGVNYNGVNLKDFSYNEKKDNFLLSLGRIARNKGIHNAIYLALKTRIPLVIAGTVEETPDSLKYFEEEIAPYIDGKNVIYIENGVNAEERKQLLEHACALLMLIEWDEPFGMVMPEAMASGTPVIGFEKGSVPEIVAKGTGFVVSSLDEARMAVNEIVKGNYSSQLCRMRVEKLFSREAMAARNIYYYMKQEKFFRKLQ
jgi:glycosyltransferase involved in cell wall biosynthesis